MLSGVVKSTCDNIGLARVVDNEAESVENRKDAVGKVMRRALRARWLDLAIALAIFVLTLAIYNANLTSSLSYKSADGNELATVCYTLGLAHSTGYPLYTWLGKLFTFIPVGDVAHRVNLMSAIMGAAGVALLYLIMLTLIGVVQSVAGRSVTIKTGEGPRLVLVSDETRVRWHDDREASLADLRRNVGVAVFGQFGDDGRTITASVIVILPPKT